MKIKLVFFDWMKRGKSVYATPEGIGLSKGDFHSGTTFEGEITLDKYQEAELRRAILKAYQPCFWIPAYYGDFMKEGK